VAAVTRRSRRPTRGVHDLGHDSHGHHARDVHHCRRPGSALVGQDPPRAAGWAKTEPTPLKKPAKETVAVSPGISVASVPSGLSSGSDGLIGSAYSSSRERYPINPVGTSVNGLLPKARPRVGDCMSIVPPPSLKSGRTA
jgi:hypothetical protein